MRGEILSTNSLYICIYWQVKLSFYIQFTAISRFKITPKIFKACAKIQKLGFKFFRHLIWSQWLHKRSWGRKRKHNLPLLIIQALMFNSTLENYKYVCGYGLSSQLFSQDNTVCNCSSQNDLSSKFKRNMFSHCTHFPSKADSMIVVDSKSNVFITSSLRIVNSWRNVSVAIPLRQNVVSSFYGHEQVTISGHAFS